MRFSYRPCTTLGKPTWLMPGRMLTRERRDQTLRPRPQTRSRRVQPPRPDSVRPPRVSERDRPSFSREVRLRSLRDCR